MATKTKPSGGSALAARLVALLVLSVFWPAVSTAQAQTAAIPSSKTLRLIVGFPPGGTTDVLARLLAVKMSERLGQQVVVDNRAGAAGIIGADAVAKAEPDGNTLLFSSSTLATHTALYPKVPYDPQKDLTPLAFIATTPYVMVVHPSLPVKTVDDLVKYARARPGQLNYAASAPGTAQHLAWEKFKRSTGTDIVFVPYKGTGALMTDLLAGRLQLGIDNVAVLTQQVKAGALRPLAVTGAVRSALLPDVPTIAEAGQPGLQVVGWFGVFGPAKMPAALEQRLSTAFVEVMAQKDVKDRIIELGGEPERGGADDLRKLLATEMATWGKVIRDAGIKAE